MGTMMARLGSMPIEPAEIEHHLHDNQELDFIQGLRVLHAPGYAAGQVVFLWLKHVGVSVAADTGGNIVGFGYPPIFEDLEEELHTLKKLAALDLEVAVFGQSKPIIGGAAKKFKQRSG